MTRLFLYMLFAVTTLLTSCGGNIGLSQNKKIYNDIIKNKNQNINLIEECKEIMAQEKSKKENKNDENNTLMEVISYCRDIEKYYIPVYIKISNDNIIINQDNFDNILYNIDITKDCIDMLITSLGDR